MKDKKRISGELAEDIGEYDYDNANDTANFCPRLQVRTLRNAIFNGFFGALLTPVMKPGSSRTVTTRSKASQDRTTLSP